MQHPIRASTESEKTTPHESQHFDIELEFGHLGSFESTFINGINPKVFSYTSNGDLLVQPLFQFLAEKGYQTSNSMISYFSNKENMYVFIGNDPLAADAAIPREELKTAALKIKLRYSPQIEAPIPNVEDDDAGSDKGGKGSKRTKERKIGYIVEKVARWRNLYNGIQNLKGETVRMTLEEAATQVGISKKSLDDYLLQLRFGRKFGFNFEEHKNDKVGILRAYVKKYKQIQNEMSKLSPGEQLSKESQEILNQKGTPSCKARKCCVPPPGVLKFPAQNQASLGIMEFSYNPLSIV
ncbi:unnamed protein product [Blepharisma stoltei]|uniref:Uncharacterized protein n=1 Tax=Blepharisma stoltei TaxID=1481888 RepID=A0AAU9JMK8_9CILI|nr:unnamed protein product [Blepharisma stoltei]